VTRPDNGGITNDQIRADGIAAPGSRVWRGAIWPLAARLGFPDRVGVAASAGGLTVP
jgi:hypothetical protein